MNSKTVVPTASAAENQTQEAPGVPQHSVAPTDYGTTAHFFNEIRDFLTQHPGLTTDAALKLTYFAFAILFAECAQAWPLALVVAPDTTGSSLLLRMFASVCVAPVHVGDITRSAMLTLPPSPRPTPLIIDQLVPNGELERLLRVMGRPGAQVLRNGKFFDLFLPTLVCTAEPLRDGWITDQALQIALSPSRGPLPKFDSESFNESGRHFRGKLRRYSEVNLAAVRGSQFDAPSFSSPTRELACMLGASIVDDPALQRCVPMLLESQDQDVRIRHADSIPAVTVEALLFLSHELSRRQALMGEIATIVNGILKGRGEIFEVDPREVGNYVRALGCFSERLGRAGRGIRFSRTVRSRIHELAEGYDVRTKLENPTCEFCADARARAVEAQKRGT